ncbi:MAG: zeta toxin family protein [Anaerolineales bacterium]|jgi:uridine kinase
MKGDIVVLEPYHREAARKIVPAILGKIDDKPARYAITVAGESGSGKSETAQAIKEELQKAGINAVVLAQDDYFVLPPRSNDARRRSDPDWLGPHVEVRIDLLEQHLLAAIDGADSITKPLVDYDADTIEEESVELGGVDVIIVEGTYTSLLKCTDTRIFIMRTRVDTLAHRQKRARGSEAGDPFIENILKMEHKIIAGHRYLANILITKEYDVVLLD